MTAEEIREAQEIIEAVQSGKMPETLEEKSEWIKKMLALDAKMQALKKELGIELPPKKVERCEICGAELDGPFPLFCHLCNKAVCKTCRESFEREGGHWAGMLCVECVRKVFPYRDGKDVGK